MAMFPPEEQDVVRIRLAESLHAVVSQRLLPRADARGRVPACEVMINTSTIRELMLDANRVGEIRDYIADGREQYGMQTFDQHLADLVTEGVVEFEVALGAATRPSDFELEMRTFRQGGAAAPSARAATPAGGASLGAADKSDSPGGLGGMTTGGGYDFLGGTGQ
jgi:twitching motility protein PilT